MDSEKPIQNEPSPHTGGESDKQSDKSKTDVPAASTISKSSPTKSHCEITCKQEKHWWDKIKPFVEILGIILLLIYTAYTIKMYCATNKAANAAKDSADWTKQQTQFLFDVQRPTVWVKMLDNIHIEVGKPVTATVEVFNYGQFPAQVWAYGYAEIGTSVIEKVRDHPLGNSVEGKDNRIILLAPHEGTKDFPVETQRRVLTKEDLRLITSGEMEVVVYGHIDYSDPRNPWLSLPSTPDVFITRFMSSFCFHRLKDGVVSVCPNYKKAYTNWDP